MLACAHMVGEGVVAHWASSLTQALWNTFFFMFENVPVRGWAEMFNNISGDNYGDYEVGWDFVIGL